MLRACRQLVHCCIVRVILTERPQVVILKERPQVVILKERPQVVILKERPQVVILKERPQVVILKERPQVVILKEPQATEGSRRLHGDPSRRHVSHGLTQDDSLKMSP
jgi:hypothetical protein